MDDTEQRAMIQYQVVAKRRDGTDAMVWQVPVIGLAAQSLLFSAALSHHATPTAQSVAAGLALIVSLASMHVMARHRYFETEDSKWLEGFEKDRLQLGLTSCHARRVGPQGDGVIEWILRRRSYHVWMGVLVVFAIAAATMMLKPALFRVIVAT